MIATKTAQEGRKSHAASKPTQMPADAAQSLSNHGYMATLRANQAVLRIAKDIEANMRTIAECLDSIQLSLVRGYLRDLEAAKAGSPIFDRMVDAHGSPLGGEQRWRMLVGQKLATADLSTPEWSECLQRASALGIEVAGSAI